MPKATKQTRAGTSARVFSPPRPVRVEIKVRRSGRTMRVTPGEAKALVGLKVADYIARAITPAPAQASAPASEPAAYDRRDMVAQGFNPYETK